MRPIVSLLSFVRPYWHRALLALVLLSSLVVMDLAIPCLIQRIIDEGITAQDQQVVLRTGLLMLGISALSAVIAVGNNLFSIQVGEGVELALVSWTGEMTCTLRPGDGPGKRVTLNAPGGAR
jgi:ATP-binding cassette subfamily B protein